MHTELVMILVLVLTSSCSCPPQNTLGCHFHQTAGPLSIEITRCVHTTLDEAVFCLTNMLIDILYIVMDQWVMLRTFITVYAHSYNVSLQDECMLYMVTHCNGHT